MNEDYPVALIRRANEYSMERTEADGGPRSTVYQIEVMGWLAGYDAAKKDAETGSP